MQEPTFKTAELPSTVIDENLTRSDGVNDSGTSSTLVKDVNKDSGMR